jgi:hypothetical protein
MSLIINDEMVCPVCSAYLEGNKQYCANGHRIYYCDEECWLFRWNRCITKDQKYWICDKPDFYER